MRRRWERCEAIRKSIIRALKRGDIEYGGLAAIPLSEGISHKPLEIERVISNMLDADEIRMSTVVRHPETGRIMVYLDGDIPETVWDISTGNDLKVSMSMLGHVYILDTDEQGLTKKQAAEVERIMKEFREE